MVEALIVIAIIGILMGLAAPQFNDLSAQRQVASSTQRLVNMIQRAKNEARSRYNMVSLSHAGSSWQNALSLYAVDSGIASQDFVAADDRLIHQEVAGAARVQVSSSDRPRPWISFDSRGWIVSSAGLTLTVCAGMGGSEHYSNTVTVLPSGLTRITDTSGDGVC